MASRFISLLHSLVFSRVLISATFIPYIGLVVGELTLLRTAIEQVCTMFQQNHLYLGFLIVLFHIIVLLALLVNILLTIQDIHTLLRLARELSAFEVEVALCAIGVDGAYLLDAGSLVIGNQH